MFFFLFKNWIKGTFIYINDILNENGEISQHVILQKIENKFCKKLKINPTE